MKKIFIFLIASLFWCNASLADRLIGKGELRFNNEMIDYFMNYLKTPPNQSPLVFLMAITENNKWYATFWYCPVNVCKQTGNANRIKQCNINFRKMYGEDGECFIFAKKRYVVWRNGINPADYRKSTFKSSWNRDKVIAKLTELGFYGNSTSSVATTKQKKNKKKSEPNIVEDLKSLKDLLDNGAITQEEYEKGKQKILN